MAHAQEQGPPSPPEVPSSFRMHRHEAIGKIALALLPLLAIFGMLDPHQRTSVEANAVISLEVRYPDRMRLGRKHPFEVRVTNKTAAMVEAAGIHFDPGYIRGFSSPNFNPTPAQAAFVVPVLNLAAGETRLLAMELEAENEGMHRGNIRAVAGGTTVTARIATLNLP